jgi:polysaccharide biosynthesis transport protein
LPSERSDPQVTTFREYGRVVWRRKWLVIGAAVLFFVLALGYSLTRTPLYSATATLIYQSQLNISDPLSPSGYVDPSVRTTELASVADVIAGPSLVKSVRDSLGAKADYSVTATPQTAAGASDPSTVAISAVSTDARTASKAANTTATAFIALRKAQQQAQIRQAEEVVQARIDALKSSGDKTSADYLTLVGRLHDLQILEATVTGNFNLVVPASPPSAPFTPQTKRNAAAGLVGGLILGVIAVLLLEQFDTRVRTSEDLTSIFGMPLVGRLPKMPAKRAASQPLFVLQDPRGLEAEAIRKLRGNLEFANVDNDLKSFFITSSLQHEGKSLTITNLALSMAATGMKVLLVDGDMRRPQIHAYLQLPNVVGLSTVLTGRTKAKDAIRSVSIGPRVTVARGDADAGSLNGREHLFVLTSGPVPPNPSEMIASKSFLRLMTEMTPEFDMVIVDAPSVLAVGDAAAIAMCVDGVVFLVDLTAARRPALAEASTQIDRMPCRKLGLVMIDPAHSNRRYDRYAYHSSGESPLDSAVAQRVKATVSDAEAPASPLATRTQKRNASS